MTSLAVPRRANGPTVLTADARAPAMLPPILTIAKRGGSVSPYTVPLGFVQSSGIG